ncbi:Qat anti-phage system associated protein QatB [Pseudomonas sp. CR3202]|uniref:Qat anti-phage system associated protein QatB n=1 Tax=Pseudomonas sp. CR3202 TaxID=3351532 RepID=UPI003BF14A02
MERQPRQPDIGQYRERDFESKGQVMGTSKGYGGSATGLVPSWVDEPSPPTKPVPGQSGAADGTASATDPAAGPAADGFVPGALGSARSSFTRFSKGGGSGELGRAVSGYVRKGTGGSRRAARRMGASRASAGRLLSIFRDVQRVGATEVLRRLDLVALSGRPAGDVFLSMMEFICPAGGAIDEAVARQAMLANISELGKAGVGTFDEMTPGQMQDFFLDFIVRSIEGMVMAELGGRGIMLSDDVAQAERAEKQLHNFVAGATRGKLADKLGSVPALSDKDVDRVVLEIYEAAFEIIAIAGESAK